MAGMSPTLSRDYSHCPSKSSASLSVLDRKQRRPSGWGLQQINANNQKN
jgi:hypothetical protein